MATKKSSGKRRNRSGKQGRRSRQGRRTGSVFACPNPSEAMNLQDMVERMVSDPAFAAFFHEQLYLANGGDQRAVDCVASYYAGPTGIELDALGIFDPEEREQLQRGCTEHNRLLDVVAYALGGK